MAFWRDKYFYNNPKFYELLYWRRDKVPPAPDLPPYRKHTRTSNDAMIQSFDLHVTERTVKRREVHATNSKTRSSGKPIKGSPPSAYINFSRIHEFQLRCSPIMLSLSKMLSNFLVRELTVNKPDASPDHGHLSVSWGSKRSPPIRVVRDVMSSKFLPLGGIRHDHVPP